MTQDAMTVLDLLQRAAPCTADTINALTGTISRRAVVELIELGHVYIVEVDGEFVYHLVTR
jgi:uncharacterized membrane protein (DUF2068 family)